MSSFPLLDILDLLSRTGRTGELQVVGQGLDRRIWVDRGDLVDTGATGSPATGLFEMACIEDGWFYFTLADSTPEVTARATIPSVVEGLAGQVAEWHALVTAFPFDAVVRMSSTTPADEVQIRADQWQLLSLVGAGREVREVLASSPLHPLDTLRTLQELAGGHLVSVDPAGAEVPTVPAAATAGAANGSAAGETAAAGPDGRAGQEPLPATVPGAAAGTAPRTAAGDTPARGTPARGTPAVGPAPDGDQPDGDQPDGTPAGTAPGAAPAAPDGPPGQAGRDAPARLPGPVMPPPISGDPWSGALAAPPGTEPAAGDDRG